MIEPKKINEIGDWWDNCDPGFYIYDVDGPDFRLALIENNRFIFELVRISKWDLRRKISFYYYMQHGVKSATFPEIMGLLSEQYPDVAEYFLFHLDELRK